VRSKLELGLEVSRLPFEGDFNHYYASAVMVLQRTSPFCRELSDVLNDPRIVHVFFLTQTTNPPFFALMSAPLALLPIEAAWQSWEGILLLSLVVSLLIAGKLLKWSWREQLIAGLILIESSPAMQSFRFAQVQPFLLLVVVLGWAALREGRTVL